MFTTQDLDEIAEAAARGNSHHLFHQICSMAKEKALEASLLQGFNKCTKILEDRK